MSALPTIDEALNHLQDAGSLVLSAIRAEVTASSPDPVPTIHARLLLTAQSDIDRAIGSLMAATEHPVS